MSALPSGGGAGGGSLPNGADADLRTVIGWTYSQEEVLAGEGIADRWSVLAQHVEEDDRLQVQRTWLQGLRTGHPALILQFAHGSQGFGNGNQELPSGGGRLAPGTAFDGELAYFPSALPLRALVKSRTNDTVDAAIDGHPTISAAIDAYGRAVSAFPWLDRFPATLSDVVPAIVGDRWQVVDTENVAMPVSPRFAAGWRLLALSGGHPVTICGEWNGVHFLPLAVVCIEAGKRRYTSLT